MPFFYQMSLPTKNIYAFENRGRHFTDLCGLFVINIAGFFEYRVQGSFILF